MLKLTKLQCFKILIVYSLLALAAYCCYNAKTLLMTVTRRPFQCADKSLAKPFVNDTVPSQQLHLLGIYFPIVLIVTCELISSGSTQNVFNSVAWLRKYILRTVILVTLFLIGLAVERLYKNVAKRKMARLRPNFLAVCQPVNSNGATCLSLSQPVVMSEYECSATSYPAWAVSSAFTSFPSGHTSLTAYAMVFSICYLHLSTFRLQRSQICSTLGILIVQALCFLIILFVATSRVLDFRHHWSDVCAGFIGGCSIALAVNYYLQSQLENMEKWLAEVTRGAAENDVTVEAGCVTTNKNEQKGKCTLEMVSQQ